MSVEAKPLTFTFSGTKELSSREGVQFSGSLVMLDREKRDRQPRFPGCQSLFVAGIKKIRLSRTRLFCP